MKKTALRRTGPARRSRLSPRFEMLERREVFSTTPYLVPSSPHIEFTPILTVGDNVPQTGGGSYRMAGIPDGLGAFDNHDGTFTVLMNHELSSAVGVTRDHGSTGAFVSKWIIDKSTLQVLEGDDLIKQVYVWNTTTNSYDAATTAFSRLCSADLPESTAFYNPASGLGTHARIFMNGEETSNGRAFAHVVDGPAGGTSWELPWTGKYAWENHVASPYAQNKTIVVGLDDSSRSFSAEGAAQPSEVYVWVGNKQSTGLDVEKAGLVQGILYGLRVGTPGSYDANESTVASGERFELVGLSDQTNNATFAPLQAESIAQSITQFRRVEDGAFDPNRPNDFYFVTTDQFGASGASKLWRLRFDDITNPAAGGTIEILINGGGVGANTGFGTGEMFDNLAVDQQGRVILQEDVGNQTLLGKIWAYDIASGAVLEVGRHNPDLFLSSSAGYLGTQDEESSGVIDLSDILGEGYYLVDVQVHKNISATEPELVEPGQLLVMRVGATVGIGFDAADNSPALVLLGTSRNDHWTVSQDGSTLTVRYGRQNLGEFAADAVFGLLASGYAGNDHFNYAGIDLDTRTFGGAGNDQAWAGDGRDTFFGGLGNDGFDGDDSDVFADFGLGRDHRRARCRR